MALPVVGGGQVRHACPATSAEAFVAKGHDGADMQYARLLLTERLLLARSS